MAASVVSKNIMSSVESLISFEYLNHLLVPVGALNSPAELHGMLTGKLTGGLRLESDEWLAQALEFLDVITNEEHGVESDPEGKTQAELARLYHVTLAQLQDQGYSFQLMLPDDEATLEDRARALGEWCHGFLTGFGSAGIDPNAKFSEDAADALRDMAAIVSIGDGADEEAEEAESNLMEIGEYVRMAVLTLFADFGGEEGSDESAPTVH
jgi:yecA family protein